MFDIISFIPRAVVQGVPLLYGSTGEILTEKSGNLNLGIPGIMYVGGICGVIGSFFYENSLPSKADISALPAILIPIVCCLLGSLLMGLLYCLLTVTLRANQNVTGLAMTTFGVGVGNFFGGSLIKLSGSEVPSIALSGTSYFFHRPLFAESEGWFYQDFLSYGFMVYLAIAIGFFVAWFMKHTRTGLHLRAVGENPNTADAASINVTKYKYMATCIGSMIAGLGGLYYVMDYANGVWSNNAFGDRLAGDCAGHLHHLALERWRVRVDSLRWTLHPAHVHPDRLKPGGEGTVQNAPLHRDHRGAVHLQPAQEAGGPAAAAFGAAIL